MNTCHAQTRKPATATKRHIVHVYPSVYVCGCGHARIGAYTCARARACVCVCYTLSDLSGVLLRVLLALCLVRARVVPCAQAVVVLRVVRGPRVRAAAEAGDVLCVLCVLCVSWGL